MSDDTAPNELRSYFDRWSRLEEEKAAISDDLRELFAEMKSNGFDTKVARKVFRDRGADANDRAEFEAIYDLYWSALDGPRAVSADARVEIVEEFAADEAATRRLDGFGSVQDGRKMSTNGLSAGVAEQQNDTVHVSVTDETAGETAPHSEMDSGAITAVKGQARLASVVDAEPSPSFVLPPAKPLRPFCQNRDRCSSGTRDHCWSCKKLMVANEAAA